jgi:hypothetical protein
MKLKYRYNRGAQHEHRPANHKAQL